MRLTLTGGRPAIDLFDPDLALTQSQRSACQIGGEVLVTAGAGSGKTHTLSLRYVVLLLEVAIDSVLASPGNPRPDIKRVLVLTFTERAAQEMAQRCYERLSDLAAACRAQAKEIESGLNSQMAQGLPVALSRLLDRIDEARISTFHGFCAGIHADFPEACGTPPETRIAEAGESDRLLRLAMEATLSDYGVHHAGDLRLLLGTFGTRRVLIDAATIALQRRSRLGDFLQRSSEGQVHVDDLISGASLSVEDVSAWLKDWGTPCLRQIAEAVKPSGGGAGFKQHIQPFVSILELPSDGPLGLYRKYSQVLGALVNDDGRLRTLTHHSIVGAKAAWLEPNERGNALARLEELGKDCSDWPVLHRESQLLPTPADDVMLSVLAALSRLVLGVAERYETLLLDQELMDFESLQERAVNAVLHDPQVTFELRERHRYIMVDEFQDTDAAQWQLVLKLGRPQGVASDRIFLVGDAKQAIYGFRGGDVTVFQAAAKELGIVPIVFPENFRSRVEIIEWLNAFFAQVLGPPSVARPDWEAAHQPLLSGRGADQGSVRLLTHPEPTGPSAAAAEARGIASFLVQSVFSPEGLFGASPTNSQGPDVAILLRARTHLHLFEEALREAGIPFHVGGGVGFWGRSEVVDLVNILHALGTEDDISLVGALRSPFFALDDDEIQGLASRRWGKPLSQFGRGSPSTEAPAHVRAVEKTWSGLIMDRHRLPWPLLLREVLVRSHAAHALELAGGKRARANAQRLVTIADGLADNGVLDLREASELLLHNVGRGEREAEAALDSQEARVALLTIHSSKGLEYPMVVLPGLDAPSPSTTSPILAQRVHGELELACRVEDAGSHLQTRITPGSWNRLSRQRMLEEDAERKRLLYVAATRARDHLVLVGGTTRIGRPGNTWMHMLADHHGAQFTGLDHAPLEYQHATRLPGARDYPQQAPPMPLPPVSPRLRLSPSGIDLFESCPARWYQSARLGAPEPRRGIAGFPAAATRGLVLHSLLEHCLEETDDEACRLWRTEAAQAGGSPDEIEQGESTLLEHIHRCRTSEPLTTALSANGYSEIAFSIEYGPLQVSGVIDRLWMDEGSGQWCILDHKSGLVGEDSSPEGPGTEHDAQLSAYAWAAEQILAAQSQHPLGPRSVFSTRSGEMWGLPNWTSQARDSFLGLLDDMIEIADSSWEEVQRGVLESSRPRPCSHCGYRDRGCTGRAVDLNQKSRPESSP